MLNLCLDCEKEGKINFWLYSELVNWKDVGLRRREGECRGENRIIVTLNKEYVYKIRIIGESTLLIK